MPKRDRMGRFASVSKIVQKGRKPKRKGKRRAGPKGNPTPLEWKKLDAGSYYPCHPWERKKVGKTVRGRKGGKITACATPAKPRKGTAAARRRRPEGQYWIGQAAAGHAMPKSRVRARLRAQRKGGKLHKDDPLAVYGGVSEFKRSGFPSPWGQPYPHRPGSSRLDPQHPAWRGYNAAVKKALKTSDRTGADPLTTLRKHPKFKTWQAINKEGAKSYDERQARKSGHSQQRERAQYRQAAREAGVDLGSAEYRDELERMR